MMTYAEIHNLCEGCDYNEPCHEPHGEVTWSCDYDGDDCPMADEHQRDMRLDAIDMACDRGATNEREDEA